jgi:hypothetical protein
MGISEPEVTQQVLSGQGVWPVVQVEPRSLERGPSGGDGEPSFFVAGSPALGEFHCAGCGYGIVVRRELPACPMCRGRSWEDPAASPGGRSRV